MTSIINSLVHCHRNWLDVVKGPLTQPSFVWDYKFGGATLSPSRITTIQNGIPNGANVPVVMVKP